MWLIEVEALITLFFDVSNVLKSNCTFAFCDLCWDRGSAHLSCGTVNQYSCFLPCWAYCCMEALALETKVFFMGFPTRRHRNL